MANIAQGSTQGWVDVTTCALSGAELAPNCLAISAITLDTSTPGRTGKVRENQPELNPRVGASGLQTVPTIAHRLMLALRLS